MKCISEYDSGDWIGFEYEERNNHILFLSVLNEINSVSGHSHNKYGRKTVKHDSTWHHNSCFIGDTYRIEGFVTDNL